MSDWQPQGDATQGGTATYPRPADAYQPPPPGYPPQATGPYPPGEPPKKRTGLIVTLVVLALLLLCCCGAGVAGLLIYRSDTGTTTSDTAESNPDLEAAKALEREMAARAADWGKVTDAFRRGDYTFVEPDERQRRLAEATIAELLPDFEIDEIAVEPGHYDKAKDYFVFDGLYVRLHLRSDPAARTAYSFDVETPEAEATGMKRDDLDLDEGDDVVQLEGRTWVIYPTGSKRPLLKGIQDATYGALVAQACADWPGGLPTSFIDQEDGTVTVSIETWDSYRYSDSYDRVEAVYARDGQGWDMTSHRAVIDSDTEEEAPPTV